MKLSVIIPCKNAESTIQSQLSALIQQNQVAPWEIIVADNGSKDKTVDVVKQLQRSIPHLHLLDASKKPGQAYARNVGALAAKGEYLAFCDADDQVGQGWLAAILRAVSIYDFVCSRFDPHKLNAPWVLKARTCPQQESVQAYVSPPFLPHASASGLAIKKLWHEKVGGFDPSMRLLEDTDYCWRLQLMGVPLHFASEAIIHYRFRDTLPDIFVQAHGYAEYNVTLYKKYRHLGMPSLPFCWKNYWRDWGRLLRKSIKLPAAHGRAANWCWQVGWRLGRLQGSLKHRVLAL